MRLDRLAGLLFALCACCAQAQLMPIDPDWKEVEAPPPPALDTNRLIRIDVERSALDFGVAPASIAVGDDGIVRYVVVATSKTGAVNAMYEAVRCRTGEVKTYARHHPGSGWAIAKDPQWQALHDNRSRHSLVIARTGACLGHGVNGTPAQIIRALRSPVDTRFTQP
ncbi:MAG TPA: CNP1-like family protein [Ramlibacter sp.]|nr:CNP1-like family protein [Ramlibacter sp.]